MYFWLDSLGDLGDVSFGKTKARQHCIRPMRKFVCKFVTLSYHTVLLASSGKGTDVSRPTHQRRLSVRLARVFFTIANWKSIFTGLWRVLLMLKGHHCSVHVESRVCNHRAIRRCAALPRWIASLNDAVYLLKRMYHFIKTHTRRQQWRMNEWFIRHRLKQHTELSGMNIETDIETRLKLSEIDTFAEVWTLTNRYWVVICYIPYRLYNLHQKWKQILNDNKNIIYKHKLCIEKLQ